MRALLLALLLASALTLSACDAFGDGGPARVDDSRAVEVATAADLETFRQDWAAAGVRDYRLRYRVVCFCGGPQVVDVRVEDGRIAEALQNGEPFPDDPVSFVLTVDALYDVAAGGFLEADAVAVRVLPGAAPIPVSVYVDSVAEMADEEVEYQVVGFEAD